MLQEKVQIILRSGKSVYKLEPQPADITDALKGFDEAEIEYVTKSGVRKSELVRTYYRRKYGNVLRVYCETIYTSS